MNPPGSRVAIDGVHRTVQESHRHHDVVGVPLRREPRQLDEVQRLAPVEAPPQLLPRGEHRSDRALRVGILAKEGVGRLADDHLGGLRRPLERAAHDVRVQRSDERRDPGEIGRAHV